MRSLLDNTRVILISLIPVLFGIVAIAFLKADIRAAAFGGVAAAWGLFSLGNRQLIADRGVFEYEMSRGMTRAMMTVSYRMFLFKDYRSCAMFVTTISAAFFILVGFAGLVFSVILKPTG